jgi:hypothetical protein
VGTENFNLRRSQVRKRGKIGFNRSLIYVHPFPPLSSDVFICPLHLSSQKYILRLKKYWRCISSHAKVTPMSPPTKKLRAATCAKLGLTSLGPFRHSCARDTLLGRDAEIVHREQGANGFPDLAEGLVVVILRTHATNGSVRFGGGGGFGGLDRCPGFERRVTRSRLLKASVIGKGKEALLDD